MNKLQTYFVTGEILIKKKFGVRIQAESAEVAKQKVIASKGGACEKITIEYVYQEKAKNTSK